MASTTPTPTQTRSRLGRPSGAMAVSLVALFMSLGGVGYAAATGSIDSREIKNNSVRSADLKNNDVRGTDIRTGTVTGSDVKDETLKGADVLESSLGTVPQATNATQANTATAASSAGNSAQLGGIAASSYPSGVEIVTAESAIVTADPAKYGTSFVTATCPAGKKVIGGGGSTTFADVVLAGTVLNVAVQDSAPNATETGWRYNSIESGGVDEEGQSWKSTAYAICAAR